MLLSSNQPGSAGAGVGRNLCLARIFGDEQPTYEDGEPALRNELMEEFM